MTFPINYGGCNRLGRIFLPKFYLIITSSFKWRSQPVQISPQFHRWLTPALLISLKNGRVKK